MCAKTLRNTAQRKTAQRIQFLASTSSGDIKTAGLRLGAHRARTLRVATQVVTLGWKKHHTVSVSQAACLRLLFLTGIVVAVLIVVAQTRPAGQRCITAQLVTAERVNIDADRTIIKTATNRAGAMCALTLRNTAHFITAERVNFDTLISSDTTQTAGLRFRAMRVDALRFAVQGETTLRIHLQAFATRQAAGLDTKTCGPGALWYAAIVGADSWKQHLATAAIEAACLRLFCLAGVVNAVWRVVVTLTQSAGRGYPTTQIITADWIDIYAYSASLQTAGQRAGAVETRTLRNTAQGETTLRIHLLACAS